MTVGGLARVALTLGGLPGGVKLPVDQKSVIKSTRTCCRWRIYKPKANNLALMPVALILVSHVPK